MSGYQVFTLGDPYTLPSGMTIQSIRLPDSPLLQGEFSGYSAKGSELQDRVSSWGDAAQKKLEKAVEFITTQVSSERDFKSPTLLGNVYTHSLENGAFEIPLGNNARIGGIPIRNPQGFLITEVWDSDHGGKADGNVFDRLKYKQGLSYKTFKHSQDAASLPFRIPSAEELAKEAEVQHQNYREDAGIFCEEVRDAMGKETPEARREGLQKVIDAWRTEPEDVLDGTEKELKDVFKSTAREGEVLTAEQARQVLKTAKGSGSPTLQALLKKHFSQFLRKGVLAASLATAGVSQGATQNQPLPEEGQNQPRIERVEQATRSSNSSPVSAPAGQTPAQTPMRGRTTPNDIPARKPENTGDTPPMKETAPDQKVPTFDEMNADFERQKAAPSTEPKNIFGRIKQGARRLVEKAKDKMLGISTGPSEYDTPSRPILGDNPMGRQSVDIQQSSHYKDGVKVSDTTTSTAMSRRSGKLNLDTVERTDFYAQAGKPDTPIQSNLSSRHSAAESDGLKVTAETEAVSYPDGRSQSRTVNNKTGETTFRQQEPFAHREWTFDKDHNLTSAVDNQWREGAPEQYREINYRADGTATERTSIVTPEGEQVSQVTRRASEIAAPQPKGSANSAETTSSHLAPGARAAGKMAAGFGIRAGAGFLGNEIGQALKDTGAVAESNGGQLMGQYGNELTMAKQKAFANLGAAGMAAAAGGIALTAGEKAAAKIVGKKAVQVGAKALPVVGTVIGAGMAVNRAVHGDFAGAGMELAGAAVDYIPGLGQAMSLGIDTSLAARDAMMKDGVCVFGAVDANGKPIMIKNEKGEEVQAVGAEISYKNNSKEGMAKWYGFDKEGKPYLAVVGSYKGDKESGEWTRLDEQGNPRGVVHFEEGKAGGDLLYTDANGKPIAKGNLTNGDYVEYHTDEQGNATEQIKQRGQFANRTPKGNWESFDRNGQLQSTVDYDNRTFKTYEPKTLAERPDLPPRVAKQGVLAPDDKIIENPPDIKTQAPLTLDVENTSRNSIPTSVQSPQDVSKPMSDIGITNPASNEGMSGRLSKMSPGVSPPKPNLDNVGQTQVAQTTQATTLAQADKTGALGSGR